MNPLPSETSGSRPRQVATMPTSPPPVLGGSPGSYSSANRRITEPTPDSQRLYPILLLASTAMSILFCFLYLTKPVILPPPATLSPASPTASAASSDTSPHRPTAQTPSLLPDAQTLPGETTAPNTQTAATPQPKAPIREGFEESNLKIQHILTALAPDGELGRVVLDVPVLYASRNLRWTPEEIQLARNLVVRLGDFQERSRLLREEGRSLLADWNHLIEASLPATDLRADSPSLPANQRDAADLPRPATYDSSDAIRLLPADPSTPPSP
jgi:hypothetical protein